jgi:hypothetical protein
MTLDVIVDRLTKVETNQKRVKKNKQMADDHRNMVVNGYEQEAEAVKMAINFLLQAEDIRALRRVAQRAFRGGMPGESRRVRATT